MSFLLSITECKNVVGGNDIHMAEIAMPLQCVQESLYKNTRMLLLRSCHLLISVDDVQYAVGG